MFTRDWGVVSETPASEARDIEFGRHRVYPLCQESSLMGCPEGGQADPLTLCASQESPKKRLLRAFLTLQKAEDPLKRDFGAM